MNVVTRGPSARSIPELNGTGRRDRHLRCSKLKILWSNFDSFRDTSPIVLSTEAESHSPQPTSKMGTSLFRSWAHPGCLSDSPAVTLLGLSSLAVVICLCTIQSSRVITIVLECFSASQWCGTLNPTKNPCACVCSCFSHVQLTLCNLMDYSPWGSSIHGILQARILEWVAIPFSRGSSQPRDQTHISYISCIGRQVLYY